jgi:hypothetical protein
LGYIKQAGTADVMVFGNSSGFKGKKHVIVFFHKKINKYQIYSFTLAKA